MAVESTRAMLDGLAHRGPDDRGSWESAGQRANVWFGHRRLAIVDLSAGGHQPMARNDGLSITFNGEIYNYRELRDELTARGHVFASDSDTEVLLAAWHEWGEAALHKLNGMFAFAVWNRNTETLWLARDRMGEKPLYYYVAPHGVIFGSELRTLLASGCVPRVLDPDGFESYLAFGSVSQPFTLVRGVRMLGAGEVLRYDAGCAVVRKYWERSCAEPADYAGTYADAKAAVLESIDKAVEACMTGDVPIGLLLSGGVDSTALLCRLAALGYGGVDTFNVDFAGVDAELNETAWALRAADEFGARHHRVTIAPGAVAEHIAAALRAVDQPSLDGFNHYFAFQAIARAGFKVALTGQGADELFYGYARHRAFALSYRAAHLRLPAALRHGMARSLTAFLPNHYRLRKSVGLFGAGERTALAYASRHCIFTAEETAHLLGRPVESPVRFLPPAIGDTPIAKLYDMYSQHFLRNQLLRDGDQMSMAVSLELRAPFVDHHVVDAVKPLPTRYKIAAHRQKPLLVDAIDHPLVTATAARPKRGFPLPLRRWLQQEIDATGLSSDLLGVHTARARQVFERGRRGLEHKQAWTLCVLATWMRDNRIAQAA